jgi:hypothetical protein
MSDQHKSPHPGPEQLAAIGRAIAGGSIKGVFKGMFAPEPEKLIVSGVKVGIALGDWIPTYEQENAIFELADMEYGSSGASGYYVVFRFEDIPTPEQVEAKIKELEEIRG